MVGEEHDPKARGQQIDARRLTGMGLRVRQQRGQIGDAAFGNALSQHPEHRLGDIDTRQMAALTDRRGERQRRRAGPAADIEHPLSRLRLRLAQQDLRDFDVARFLNLGALHPARPRDLVPVPPHRRIGSGLAVAHGIHRAEFGETVMAPTPTLPRKRGRESEAEPKTDGGLLRPSCWAARPSDDAFLLQRIDILRAEPQPGAEHLGIVLAEERRRHDLRWRAIEPHRPGRHLDLAGRRMLDRLHDAARFKRGFIHQFERVEHGARRHAGFADDLHRLFLAVLARPCRDDLVDFRRALAARILRLVTRIALQVFAADNLQQALPMLGVGAAAEHINIIVRPAWLAWVEGRRHEPALLRLVAATAQLRLPALLRARERHAHVMDHRVLHRDLQPPALAGLLPLVERAQNADRHQHPGPGVAKGGAGLHRRAVAITGDAGRAAGRLRDHVEGERFFVGAAGAKAFDLAVDDARIDLLDLVIAEPQPFDGAGRHVLDRDIGLLEQLLDDFEAARRFQIQRQRFLVRVELVEIQGSLSCLPGCGRRPGSPVRGFSILTTSAPSQARLSVQEGPASNCVKSTSRTPARQSSSIPSIALLPKKIVDRSLAPRSAAGYACGHSPGARMLPSTQSRGIAAQISDTQSPTALRFPELKIRTTAMPAIADASITVKPRKAARAPGSASPLTAAYAICARITRASAKTVQAAPRSQLSPAEDSKGQAVIRARRRSTSLAKRLAPKGRAPSLKS